MRGQHDAGLVFWPGEENETVASSNRFRVALHRVGEALGHPGGVFKAYERYRLSPEVLTSSDVYAMQVALQDAQAADSSLGTRKSPSGRPWICTGVKYLRDMHTEWVSTVREPYKNRPVRATLELPKLHCETGQ